MSDTENSKRPIHTDDLAVDRFAEAMKDKLAKKRAEGRGGWEDCPGEMLSKMLVDHVEKGDPVDVANFCMMLHQSNQRIKQIDSSPVPPSLHATILDLCDTLENRDDIPLHKWALKSARLVSKIREGLGALSEDRA